MTSDARCGAILTSAGFHYEVAAIRGKPKSEQMLKQRNVAQSHASSV
jgi:hypothetical protein